MFPHLIYIFCIQHGECQVRFAKRLSYIMEKYYKKIKKHKPADAGNSTSTIPRGKLSPQTPRGKRSLPKQGPEVSILHRHPEVSVLHRHKAQR
jgi:hypothetical protein